MNSQIPINNQFALLLEKLLKILLEIKGCLFLLIYMHIHKPNLHLFMEMFLYIYLFCFILWFRHLLI